MKWVIADKVSVNIQKNFPELHPVILQLLYNRHIKTQEEIDKFLLPDYGEDQYDPFLFLQMKQAINRIKKAIKDKEKIVVHGDYDADGVCSTVLLVSALRYLGAKNIDVYIPHREEEGYGLNKRTVEKFKSLKVNLIITVDCGLSNKEEIRMAKASGIDVIIIDHHAEPDELPPADAIICPTLKREKYPWCELAATGVAFKLVEALLGKDDGFVKWLLDLVAIATVCDYMPLLDENRTLVKWGLVVLQKTRRIGLQQLVKKARLDLDKLDASNIAWQIGPRLNAAGRLDHANTAFQLLITEDLKRAEELAEKLEKTNSRRQVISEEIYQAVKRQINPQDLILFAFGRDWPLGVVGLVAGKITDEFNRPTLIFTENNGEISGSGRSIEQFNLIAALHLCAEFFSRYGGHKGAAGFTLKAKNQLTAFQEKLKLIASRQLGQLDLEKALQIEAEVDLAEMDWRFYEELKKFEPFGEENPEPLFLARNLTIENLETVGNNAQHLKIQANGKKMIGFCFADWCTKLKNGDKINVVFELGVNEWNGQRELQFKIIDLRNA